MRKAIIVGVLIFLDFPALALSLPPPPPDQLGLGTVPCFEWTHQRKKGGAEAKPYSEWVLGYLSGWMATRRPNQKTIHLNEIDDVLKSVDHACETNPGIPMVWELKEFLHRRFDEKSER